MKIALIGYSGAGKSTLAKALGKQWDSPVLHLDTVNFLPGWKERDREEARGVVSDFLKRESWVIDGNYSALCFERRMEEADHIVFCNLPRRICLPQAWRRYRMNRHTTRDCMAAGCEEKFDWTFFMWIIRDGRTAEKKKWYRNICDTYGDKVLICRNRKDMDRVPEWIAAKEK